MGLRCSFQKISKHEMSSSKLQCGWILLEELPLMCKVERTFINWEMGGLALQKLLQRLSI